MDCVEIAGFPVWTGDDDGVEARFVGRGPVAERAAILASVVGRPLPVAWARQVHSATVLTADSGCSGEGDALVTHRQGLALAVATADCVPVIVGARNALAVIHAGWRGIAAGVVSAAVARLGDDAAALRAWIGPAIGPCCYEVDWEVASRVGAAAEAPRVVRRNAGAGRKPHLDLPAAVAAQLAQSGVRNVEVVRQCTRCAANLWSHRRDGTGLGRNLTFAWLRS